MKEMDIKEKLSISSVKGECNKTPGQLTSPAKNTKRLSKLNKTEAEILKALSMDNSILKDEGPTDRKEIEMKMKKYMNEDCLVKNNPLVENSKKCKEKILKPNGQIQATRKGRNNEFSMTISDMRMLGIKETEGLPFEKRQKYWEKVSKQMKETAVAHHLKKEQERCTFTPNALSRKHSKQKSFVEFLQKESDFVVIKNARSRSMIQDSILKNLKEMKQFPTISANTQFLLKNRKSLPNRSHSHQKVASQELSRQPSDHHQAKTKVHIQNKLSREIDEICVTCKQEMDKKISYATLYEILKSYGLINGNEDKANNERKLVIKFWSILEGEARQGIEISTLKSVLCVILKLNKQSTNDGKTNNNSKKPSYGKFDKDEVYSINSEEAKNLQTLFKPFFLNKMVKTKSIQKPQVKEVSHKPSICTKSKNIANTTRDKRRDTLMQSHINKGGKMANGSYSNAVLLMEAVAKENEKKFAKYKEKVETETNKECTFHPYVSKNSTNIVEHKRVHSSTSNSLYRLSRSIPKKDPIKTNDIEYMKQKDELTFNPKIIRSSKSKKGENSRNSIHNIKSFQASVDRLAQARIEKEYVAQVKNLGLLAKTKTKAPRSVSRNKSYSKIMKTTETDATS